MSDARLPVPRLLVLTDRRRSAAAGRPLADTVSRAVAGGARAVVLREKDLARAERRRLAGELAAVLDPVGGLLIVASDGGLARDCGAAGVHLAAADPPRAEVDPDGVLLVGRSCHDRAEVDAAASEGLDWVTVSPVFPTASKPGYGLALGIGGLAALVAAAGETAVLALGGVEPANVRACRETGVHGVAVMGPVMGAADPAAVVADLVAELAGGEPAGRRRR